eukprot:scaffold382385_cov32-Prasinocladus_malaysianus.AAC.2
MNRDTNIQIGRQTYTDRQTTYTNTPTDTHKRSASKGLDKSPGTCILSRAEKLRRLDGRPPLN